RDGWTHLYSVGGEGEEVRPTIALPREDDAGGNGPDQLVLGHHRPKPAPPARLGHPDLAAGAVRDVGHADCPGISRPPRARPTTTAAGHTGEGHLLAVGRP